MWLETKIFYETLKSMTLLKLLGLGEQALQKVLEREFAAKSRPAKTFLAKQIYNGLYVQGYKHYNQFTAVSKGDREFLEDSNISIGYGDLLQHLVSKDGTMKFLFGFGTKREIETVFIPQISRDTNNFGSLCVSSQIGCSLACKFCHTGTQKFMGN